MFDNFHFWHWKKGKVVMKYYFDGETYYDSNTLRLYKADNVISKFRRGSYKHLIIEKLLMSAQNSEGCTTDDLIQCAMINTYSAVQQVRDVIGQLKKIGVRIESNNDNYYWIELYVGREEFNLEKTEDFDIEISTLIYPKSMARNTLQTQTYVERHGLISAVEKKINECGDNKAVIIICGDAGSGKTELSKAFAFKHSNSNTEHSQGRIYEKELFVVYSYEENELIHKWFVKHKTELNERTLIILDNANIDNSDDFCQLVDDISCCTGNADLIITTVNMPMNSKCHNMCVNMSEHALLAESVDVFKKNYEQINSYGRYYFLDERDVNYVERICSLTNNNLCVIELIAIQMRENDGAIGIKNYYEYISNRTIDLKLFLNKGADILDYTHNGVKYSSEVYDAMKSILYDSVLNIIQNISIY